jgi:hypothetical protein
MQQQQQQHLGGKCAACIGRRQQIGESQDCVAASGVPAVRASHEGVCRGFKVKNSIAGCAPGM